jgi:hypothetical protein
MEGDGTGARRNRTRRVRRRAHGPIGFRLETRDRYNVDSDAGNVARYLAGDPEPSMTVKGPWLKRLAQERAEGKRRSRVHVLRSPLCDYLRYECEWGYRYTASAGEEIFILDLTEEPTPDGLIEADFLILGDAHVVLVHYDDEDRFVGAEPLPPGVLPSYLRCRAAALRAAIPFTDYWARHPEFWRANRES